MLYVYGVVPARDRVDSDLAGVGQPPAEVRLLISGSIAAAVSTIPEDFVVDEPAARAHLQVLIGLLDQGPVIPVRLGTIGDDEDAVRAEVLDAAQAELVRQLDSLDGVVELHVDADDDEAEAIAAVAAAAPRPTLQARDLESRIAVGEQIASLVVAHRQSLAEAILQRLVPLAVRNAPRSMIKTAEDPVLRWAFLVRVDEISKFDETVMDIQEDYPSLSIRYVGPLPAAHFVDSGGITEQEYTDSFTGSGKWSW
jgi:gas vesicle protein GvpL/GvpF